MSVLTPIQATTITPARSRKTSRIKHRIPPLMSLTCAAASIAVLVAYHV